MSKGSNIKKGPRSSTGPGPKSTPNKQSSMPQYRPPPRRSINPHATQALPRKSFGPRFWVISGIGITIVSAIGRLGYVALTSDSIDGQTFLIPEDVSDRFNKTAKDYDLEIDGVEKWSGLGWLRSWLTRKANGNVLEVSVGTGRNSMYYDLRECKTITMLDQSSEMMDITREKFKKAHPHYKNCRFVTQSAHNPIVSPPDGFDTILQTMGLCSTPHPVQLLKHLGTIINPDHGQILLLEHGRSHYAWLNRLLDKSAAQHADKHGCWWNRDIGRIVEESGLEVTNIKRYHFGTTWWIELKTKKQAERRDLKS